MKVNDYACVGKLLPKISVIVPIYNTEEYLEKCLHSVRNQTYKNFEVLMIDDGSTDASAQIALAYEAMDARFAYYYQANAGVSVARNRGLEVATGECVLFVDSDDWLEIQMLETLVYNMNINDADISCCQYDHNPPKNLEFIEFWNKEQVIKEFLIHHKVNGSLVNKLFRRSVIKNNRLDKNIKYGEDALFLWKVIREVSNIVMTNQVLYHVSLHHDSASGGGFKLSKMDCITVWNEIVKDTEDLFPQYLNEAKARRGHMAFYTWYEMTLSNFCNMKIETSLVVLIKSDSRAMRETNNVSLKVKILSTLLTYNSQFAKKVIVWKKQGYIMRCKK